ncbi:MULTISPECIES: hypothetical protein [Haloferax]|uniref:Uncharacterized protein n=1 Tax=Haloferax marinum TaxID=2666143 RepID=A0A6A8GAK9_9EURY|nr:MULTISPECIES: hypothetical protein [Haloferax]KAB1191155.1 hypothetical protein Hfx1150_15855 [Haloferax sp. CBA1150]MRW98041.1 hypothetical protein [Haloferax marinum]
MNDRGQAFTVEGLAAAILLLGTLVFALQATGITALSAGTAGGAAELQQADLARGVLSNAVASETLKPSLLHWNDSYVGTDGNGTYHGTGDDGYYVAGMPTAFGASLDRTLADAGYAYNVNVYYYNDSTAADNATVVSRPLVEQGTPSDDAIRAVRTVTLYDDDVLFDSGENSTDTTLAEAWNSSSFYIPDASLSSPVYNVVQVEVVAWRL